MTAFSNMASSSPSFSAIIAPSHNCRTHQHLQVRVQSFRDEGRTNNIVDANLRVLRERMEEIRVKERCCRSEHGWNYEAGYNYKHKREKMLSNYFELIGLVGGTAALTIISGTVFLCLVSLMLHLNQSVGFF